MPDLPLREFGGKGAFIAEIEEALLAGEIDLAVHSAKDLPVEDDERFVIAGVLPRQDARDVLVTRSGVCLEELEHPLIGTGSPRRRFQMKALLPDASFLELRGNVPTRLQKLKSGVCDGVILAAAGLKRLGMEQESGFWYRYFTEEEMLSAGGQGIIAIEGKTGSSASALAGAVSDWRASLELAAERRVLQILQAGCHAAIGVFAEADSQKMRLRICMEAEGAPRCADETVFWNHEEDHRAQALGLAGQLAGSL